MKITIELANVGQAIVSLQTARLEVCTRRYQLSHCPKCKEEDKERCERAIVQLDSFIHQIQEQT